MTLIPQKLVRDYDATTATDTVTKALEGMKERAASLVPKPVYQPRQQEEIPQAQVQPVMRGPAVEEPAPLPRIELPSVQEIINGPSTAEGVGRGEGETVAGGVQLYPGGDDSGPDIYAGRDSTADRPMGGGDDGGTSPLQPITLPSTEEITGIRAEPEPVAQPTMGAQPITGTESVPTGAPAPVMRTPEATAAAPTGGVPLDMSSPEAYKRTLMANAQGIAQKYDLPASIIAAIPIQEAGYKGTELTRRANNLFSIKGTGPAGSEHFGSVWEVLNGQNVQVPADFRKYNTPAESFEDFAKLITESPRYAPAVEAWKKTRDPNAFVQAVQRAGYATDPTWAGKVANIAQDMPDVPAAAPVAQPATPMPAPGASTSASFDAQSIAKQWEGKKYVFGGAGGRGAGVADSDCSGFAAEVLKQQGVNVPAHTDAAYNALKQRGAGAIDESQAAPGDVVFYMGAGTGGAVTHHMGIYAGPGKVLDMSTAGGGGVNIRPLAHAGKFEILRDPANPRTPDVPPTAAPPPEIVPTPVESGGEKPTQSQIDQWSQMATSMGEAADRIKGVPVAQAMQTGNVMAQQDLSTGGRPAGRDIGSDYGGIQTRQQGMDTTGGPVGVGEGPSGGAVATGAGNVQPFPPPRDIRGDYGPRATEPGDFAIRQDQTSQGSSGIGQETPRVPLTALTPAEPGGAVEPTPPAAPASSGNPIMDTLNGMADSISSGFRALGQHLSGANQAAVGALNTAGQPLNEPLAAVNRTAVNTLNTAGEPLNEPVDQFRRDLGQRLETPSPTMQVGQAVSSGLTGLAGASQQDMETFRVLNGRQLKGEQLTPEEEQEMSSAAVRIIGNVDGLQSAGEAVPGVIGAARRVAEQGPSAGIVSRAQADEAAQAATDRYYHGTASDFARPDPQSFDPNGLFGPGYYITDDTRVAASYANKEGQINQMLNQLGVADDAALAEERLSYAQQDLSSAWDNFHESGKSAEARRAIDEAQREVNDAKAALEAAQSGPAGQNIRPVDVPRDLRLLDADATVPDDQIRAIRNTIGDREWQDVQKWIEVTRERDKGRFPEGSGEELWRSMESKYRWDFRSLNNPFEPLQDDLRGAGIDGIRYAGGKRIPMTDEAGRAIEHNAVVIFPESLDKIRNATAGTPGGFLPGQRNIGQGIARGAVQGAVGGGYAASQEEGATPLDVARGAALGAVTRGVSSGLGAAVGPRGAGMVARAVQEGKTPRTPAESWDAVVDTLRDDVPPPLLQRAVDTVKAVPQRAIRDWFDHTVDLRKVTEQVEKSRGGKLLPHENAWLQARLLPGVGRAAELKVAESLGPAMRGLDDAHYEQFNGYLAAMDAIDKTRATGNLDRKFGRFTGAEAERAVEHLRATLPAEEFANLEQRAGIVREHVAGMRDRLAESGLISRESADLFNEKYPNYTPINFLDWMDDAERRVGSTQSLSTTQNGIKQLTEYGASYGRQRPAEALMDATFNVERRAAKNEAAQAFVNYAREDPLIGDMVRPANEAAAQYLGVEGIGRRRPNETTFAMWDKGTKHEFYIDKSLEGAFRQDQMQIGGPAGAAVRAASAVFRAGATGMNALFLTANAIGDAVTATIRGETPKALSKGYIDAFTHGPEYEAFLKAGGGYSGFVESGTAKQSARQLRGAITTGDQLKAYAKWANPLMLAQELGERIEMAPRVGAFTQAREAGAPLQEAALAGRDVTMDFARAGLWSRAINQIVPFFNVGTQSPAQVARFLSKTAPGEIRPGQREALMRVAGGVVAPVVAMEAYNRTHESYADVPQYDKDRGLIVMDPRGPGDTDPDTGRPTPRYAILALREWTPFAIATRAALDNKLGPDHWRDLAFRMSQYSSPVSLEEGVSALLPPWMAVPIEMKANYDGFRGRSIIPEGVADRLPEEQYTRTTSETSKLIGRAIQKPPAMIEHAIRGIGTGVAGQALAASDMALRAAGAAPPKEETGLVKDIPVVGGLAGRFYREQGGEQNKQEREQGTSGMADLMRSAGLRGDEIQPVGWTIKETPLTSAEHGRYQLAFNTYFSEELQSEMERSRWDDEPERRAEMARAAASRARRQAERDMLDEGILDERGERQERALVRR